MKSQPGALEIAKWMRIRMAIESQSKRLTMKR
jgi:hypothetical protein